MKTFKELFEENQNNIITELYIADFANNYVKFINKYGRQKDIYIRYSIEPTDFSIKNIPQRKIGDTDHGDPIGVYAYPISFIKNQLTKFRLFADYPYVNFLQDNSKNKLIIQKEWMFNDFSKAREYLERVFPNNIQARKLMNIYLMKNQDKAKTEILFARAILYALQHYAIDGSIKLLSGAKQTATFINAGYDAIEDLGRKTYESIIAPDGSEPQIIFLKRNSFNVIETLTNPKMGNITKETLYGFFNKITFSISNKINLRILNKKFNFEIQRGEIIFDKGIYLALTFNSMIGYSKRSLKIDEISIKILILSPYQFEYNISYPPKTRIQQISSDITNWWNGVKNKEQNKYLKYWNAEDINENV